MAKTELLRVEHVRDAYGLIGDGRLVTRSRRQLLSDADWYGSYFFNEYQRPVNIEDRLTSVYQVSEAGAISVLVLHRGVGERKFSPRELRLLNFVHDEVGRLIGR